MSRLGADVDQLDQLARSFDAAAERLEHNASVIEWQLRNLWWSGSAADRFTASWASADRKHLSVIAATLRDVGHSVQRQAAQQRRASGPGGAGAIRFGNWADITPRSPHATHFDFGMETIFFTADTALQIIEKLGIARGIEGTAAFFQSAPFKFLAGASLISAGLDLAFDHRDDGLAWLESGADLLNVGAAVLFLASNPAGWAVGAAAFAINTGLWIHDNWEVVTDVAGNVADFVVDTTTMLVAPAVEAVETIVDVTETVVDVVGDGIEAIGDGIEAVGDVFSGAGRLIGGLFS